MNYMFYVLLVMSGTTHGMLKKIGIKKGKEKVRAEHTQDDEPCPLERLPRLIQDMIVEYAPHGPYESDDAFTARMYAHIPDDGKRGTKLNIPYKDAYIERNADGYITYKKGRIFGRRCQHLTKRHCMLVQTLMAVSIKRGLVASLYTRRSLTGSWYKQNAEAPLVQLREIVDQKPTIRYINLELPEDSQEIVRIRPYQTDVYKRWGYRPVRDKPNYMRKVFNCLAVGQHGREMIVALARSDEIEIHRLVGMKWMILDGWSGWRSNLDFRRYWPERFITAIDFNEQGTKLGIRYYLKKDDSKHEHVDMVNIHEEDSLSTSFKKRGVCRQLACSDEPKQ